jgi:hypothetical protein
MSNRLPVLAAEIDREHQAAHRAARTAIEHAIECGRLLLEAKALIPHGEWLPWLEANTMVSARQSQRYMRLTSATLAGKCDATSFLTIEGALKALVATKDEEIEQQSQAVPLAVYLAENRPLEPEEIRIPIADVLPAPPQARRETVYPESIQRLARYLHHLPPIEINQHNELIDGWHRLEAHKLAGAKTIVAIVTPVQDLWHHVRIFCMRNSRHGIPYSLEEERQLAAEFGEAFLDEVSKETRAEWWRKRRAGEDEHAPSTSYPLADGGNRVAVADSGSVE